MGLAHHEQLIDLWHDTCRALTYAFQPIVATHTGQVVAYEALVRGWHERGYRSIAELLDHAANDGVLLEVNEMLLARAIECYTLIAPAVAPGDEHWSLRLNFNIDNRVFEFDDASTRLLAVVDASAVSAENVTIEISETQGLPTQAHERHHIPFLRGHGILIALDDFGSGYSGLQMLYEAQSDVVKMDRFFIDGISDDATKRIFVSNLVGIAHAIGLHVVAEGVETREDYLVCREIGCDSIQGYLIERPTCDYPTLPMRYSVINELVAGDRRTTDSSGAKLKAKIRAIEPIRYGTPMLDVLRRFRTDRELSFIPVVDERDEPMGILREHDLKEYVYSPYGISLLMNRSYEGEPYGYIRRVPVVPASAQLDRVLELATLDNATEALIVTENGRYVGCLESRALIQLLHERELTSARDQNPLTRLPGNSVISERIAGAVSSSTRWQVIAYFDFDSFKPFNDAYGFRVGDRVIQLFADLLRTRGCPVGDFAGHVGGDDFVVLMERDATAVAEALDAVGAIIERFTHDVRAFYTEDDRIADGILARDRDGVERRYPLLTVSAAILVVPPHDEPLSLHRVSREIATAKQRAKHSPGHKNAVSLIPSRLREGCAPH